MGQFQLENQNLATSGVRIAAASMGEFQNQPTRLAVMLLRHIGMLQNFLIIFRDCSSISAPDSRRALTDGS